MWVEILVALLYVVALSGALHRVRRTGRRDRPRQPHPFARTPRHYRRLYSRRNFLKLGGAVAGAAVLAYSGADEAVDDWHRTHVRGPATERLAGPLHSFGERFWFAVWGGFALIDAFVATTSLTRWGRASFEAMVVGLPALWTVQRGLGAARPRDDTHGPRFVPFADDNAASGHAFIGAIPWLTAARRVGAGTPRALALALSPWVGWSRIHDGKHYLSQVLLGYGIAWEAVAAVDAVEDHGRLSGARDSVPPEAPSSAAPRETSPATPHSP